jgi:hypothetical protein
MSRRAYSRAVLAGAVIAYFVIFPADLGFLQQLLSLTQAVATGAWAFLTALVLVAGVVRIWGRSVITTSGSELP